jgi:GTPase SAR1 family protein
MHTKIKDVLALVYDTTSKRSFKDISGIFDAHEHPRNIITVLVGNKTDLKEQREVQKHEGMELAHKLGAFFWEVSALKGDSIKEMFQRMVFLVLDRQCYSLNGATEANADTPEKDFMDFETPQTGFWNIFCHVIFPCMGRA